MERRTFIKATSVVGGGYFLSGPSSIAKAMSDIEMPWFDKSMRWIQFAMVENDPGRFDPDYWLAYFKKIHADGVLLNAGGGVAYYPTNIPLHHRSSWLGNSDPFGYMVNGCRKMNMTIIARTDPHAARQEVYEAHPDWIQVQANGEKRRHWANPELWVTCPLGPYNFDFMVKVNKEIMERYSPSGIFSNRWTGNGICYCEHCKKNFMDYAGLEIPKSSDRLDPIFRKYSEWRVNRLKELWFLWDEGIRKIKPSARFIPNGFPDKLLTGEKSDFFFADEQTRSGMIPPWLNARGAKELRASLGMKPLVGIYSVGVIDEHRWTDSMQNGAEIRIWAAEGLAHGKRPCFVKFSGVMYDSRRWKDTIPGIYEDCYKHEKYLRNTAPIVRVGMVFSEQTEKNYGGAAWQQKYHDHSTGMYHALVESRIPFDMVNDRLLDEEHLKRFRLLVLPNIAALSDKQCMMLKKFVEDGGSIVATFETSLYDEEGKQRENFGLGDVFGVTYDKGVEGPMQNSYLRFKNDPVTKQFHPVLEGLEDAFRVINFIYRVKVKPAADFPSPVTLIPSYPDLPMEDVYPRIPDTDTRELYLREYGKGRVAYFPGDADRSFWEIMNTDHLQLLDNTFRWALNEEPVITVKGPGIVDIALWKQKNSMTVHLVNLTNPMMMKGPYRELLPLAAQQVTFKLPAGSTAKGVKLLISGKESNAKVDGGNVSLTVPHILDHEIIAVDLV
jgi:hypothetical protein